MPIEGFDYKQFSSDLATQAKELVPQDFEPFQKDYVVKTLANFSLMAGEAISNDAEAGFNAEQAIFLTQIIAEWSFHKSVDEIGKNTIKQNMPQDKILELVESQVLKAYEEALDELQQRGIIDEELKENAAKQNNLNQLVEQVEAEQAAQREAEAQAAAQQQEVQQNVSTQQPMQSQQYAGDDRKLFKLASLALLLRTMSQDKISSILNKFNPQDAQLVIQYMQMPDLNQKVDANTAIQCLKEIKTSLPSKHATTPNQLIYRIKNSLQNVPRENLELFLKQERINVKRFVTTALQDELYELPPKVANVIAQHIESSV